MFTFGARIILLLLLIGGAVAVIGDYIGHVIGRRRLTLFNLRPRHTAFAVTVLTGIFIVFSTLGVVLAISQDARTALFGLEELRKDLAGKKEELAVRVAEKEKVDAEIKDIQKELGTAKASLRRAKAGISALEKTKDKLSKEVEISRQGSVLFRVDEVLLSSVIQAGPEKAKLESGLKQILSAADAYVRSFGVKDKKHLIFVAPEEFSRAVAALQQSRNENLVRVIATRNTLYGEQVPVRFEVQANRLVYKKGEEIAQLEIPHSLSVPEIEQEIKRLLYDTHLAARKAGLSPEPGGSIGSVPYSQIFALAKKINKYKKGVTLKTLAKEKTYAMGPLEVDFKVLYR